MELLRVITPEEPCPYLAGEEASFDYRFIQDIRPSEYEAMLQRGWRRFGNSFFRPACNRCSKCISLRIPVPKFNPSRAQRRCLASNSDIEVAICRPHISDEHFELYDIYHADMVDRRGWPAKIAKGYSYRESFVDGANEFGYEFQYRIGGRLVGVALVDVLPSTLSSVYFYYDPDLRRRGLGIFSILKQLEFCSAQGISDQHLGYWVQGSPSMTYKCQFRPFEILHGRPADDQAPDWRIGSES